MFIPPSLDPVLTQSQAQYALCTPVLMSEYEALTRLQIMVHFAERPGKVTASIELQYPGFSIDFFSSPEFVTVDLFSAKGLDPGLEAESI